MSLKSASACAGYRALVDRGFIPTTHCTYVGPGTMLLLAAREGRKKELQCQITDCCQLLRKARRQWKPMRTFSAFCRPNEKKHNCSTLLRISMRAHERIEKA